MDYGLEVLLGGELTNCGERRRERTGQWRADGRDL